VQANIKLTVFLSLDLTLKWTYEGNIPQLYSEPWVCSKTIRFSLSNVNTTLLSENLTEVKGNPHVLMSVINEQKRVANIYQPVKTKRGLWTRILGWNLCVVLDRCSQCNNTCMGLLLPRSTEDYPCIAAVATILGRGLSNSEPILRSNPQHVTGFKLASSGRNYLLSLNNNSTLARKLLPCSWLSSSKTIQWIWARHTKALPPLRDT